MPVRFHPRLEPLLVDIESVKQHPDNARNGDVDAIVSSIVANGFIAPVIVQRSTGYILAGNHRYQALLMLDAEVIPVIEVDVDDMAAKRYLVADNRTSDLGVYDQGLLADLLQELSASEQGLIGTGYTDLDLEVLLAENAQPGEFERGMKGFTQTLMLVFPSGVYTKVCEALDSYGRSVGTADRGHALALMLGVGDDDDE